MKRTIKDFANTTLLRIVNWGYYPAVISPAGMELYRAYRRCAYFRKLCLIGEGQDCLEGDRSGIGKKRTEWTGKEYIGMQYIVCASYFATGSSAVTDLIGEYENVALPKGGLEWRFLQDPDGVRALEYYVIENNHRHNTSHAIKRFIKMCKLTQKKWYSHSIGDDFINAAREYVDNITELKSETVWLYDNFEKPIAQKVLSKLFYVVVHTWNRFHRKKVCDNLLGYTHEMGYYTNISREEFYQHTRQFISHVFKRFQDSDFVMVDQLLPPTNTADYFRYFEDNIKVIIVERDPRDLWLLLKKVYDERVTPRRLDEWCKWYEITRRHRNTEKFDEERVMLIHFEDLIYKYEDTVARLERFIGLDPSMHREIKKKFDPARSVVNTNIAQRMPEFADEVAYIEKNLPQYLYQFPDNAEEFLKNSNLRMF